jgi:enoyl-CoA hydratase
MNDSFLLSLQGPVAHLQLNHPEHANTFVADFFTSLRDAVRGLHSGGVVRVLVISSTGAHFSAGLAAHGTRTMPSKNPTPVHPAFPAEAQPALQTTPHADRRDPRESSVREAIGAIMHMLDEPTTAAVPAAGPAPHQASDCFDALDEAPFPVICAVQGGCAGAALALACACDIRLCSADAFFTPDEAGQSGSADHGVLQRLRRVIAPGAAHELVYTGDRLGATRAHELGLVNTVLPDAAALLQHALALAGRIAARSPLAVAGAKAALRWPSDAAQRPEPKG